MITTFRVNGMTCGHCVNAVTEELTALDAVADVTVDLVAGGTSTVTITTDTAVADDVLIAAIDEAGYAVAGPRDLPLA